jgi:metal-responsive CopG/Arc/MetJ family transcriptional regulator
MGDVENAFSGRAESTEPKTVKFQMMLTETEVRLLDDFRYANREPSRADAIRRLIRLGLEKHREDTGSTGE